MSEQASRHDAGRPPRAAELRERVLLVAATEPELGPLREMLEEPYPLEAAPYDLAPVAGHLGRVPVALAALGVGKSNTAFGLTALSCLARPRAVVQVGIAGAYAGSFVPVGAVACASEEHDLDAGLRSASGDAGMAALGFGLAPWADPAREDRFPTDANLTAALARACGMEPVPFGTSDGVSGDLDVAEARAARSGASVESMEGAAAAQVCLRLGVPFAEARGISNVAGQRDPEAWQGHAPLQRCAQAVRRGLAEWWASAG